MRHLQQAATLLVVIGTGLLAGASDASAQPKNRGFFNLNGAYQTTKTDFRGNARFTLNVEDGDLDGDYAIGAGPAFDVAVGEQVWRNLMAGIVLTYFQEKGSVAVNARLPHPFQFSQPRAVSGEANGLKREEFGLHVQAVWLVPFGDKVDVALAGGPSYFHLKQPFVNGVTFTEDYPFDSATYTGVVTERKSDGGFGFNAGVDVTWLLSDHVGIGGGLRFSQGTVKFTSGDGGRTSVDVGGLHGVAGLRVRW